MEFLENTYPESPETLASQIDALKKGRVKAVLFTPGETLPRPPTSMKTISTDVGTWVYDPLKISGKKISDKVSNGTHGEILGYVEPKSEKTIADVTAYSRDGIELKSAFTSPENIEKQKLEFKKQFPNSNVRVGGVGQSIDVLKKRIEMNPKFKFIDDDQDEFSPEKKLGLLYGGIPADSLSPEKLSPQVIDRDSQSSAMDEIKPVDVPQASVESKLQSEKKPSFFQKVFGIPGASDAPQTDEYGLQIPKQSKANPLLKILAVALPTIFGMSRGLGPLPGLMAGMGGYYKGKSEREEKEQENYEKARREKASEHLSLLRASQPSGLSKEVRDYMRMSPDEQKVAMQLKTIGRDFINPLDLAKFNYQKSQDALKREDKIQEDVSKKEQGARLPADKAALLAEGDQLGGVLDNLEKTLDANKNIGGPIMGRIMGLNPYAKETQSVQSNIDSVRQFVGKYLEGGVLRKEDEAKYAKILPTLTDTPEVRKVKIENIKKLIRDKQSEYKKSFSQAGYNMSGYDGSRNISAQATKTITPKIKEALDWANSNPDDPRAKEILKRYGA